MNDSKPLVVANLKANLTWAQVSNWLDSVALHAQDFAGTVIFCPSYPFIAASQQKITAENLKISLGVQDLSQFEQGAYTGEVTASQIKDLVKFAIIGHSERRTNLKEDDDILAKKVTNAQAAQIEAIFCVQGPDVQIPPNLAIVAYEPTYAIGTNNPEPAEKTRETVDAIKSKGSYKVLYGGSVAADNVKSYLTTANADGVLVGATNSLDPQTFIQILEALK